MDSKLIDKGNYKVHFYKMDKFKTINVHILLRSIRKQDDYLITALIGLLFLTNKTFKTKKERIIRAEELYNISYNISKNRRGMHNIIDINVSFVNPKYVDDDYLCDAIQFPFDIFNNPLFDESRLDEIKELMNRAFSDRDEYPSDHADRIAWDIYYDKDEYKTKFYPEKEIVDSITMDQIKNKYEELINESQVDVYISAEEYDDRIIDVIDKNIKFKGNTITDTYLMEPAKRNKVQKYVDVKNGYNQAQLIMIFNVKKYDLKDKRFIFFDEIMGGGGLSSRLFKKVREENQLCYNISSDYSRIDRTFAIYTSLDQSNVDKAIKLIKQVVKDMKNVKQEEVDNALNTFISNMESSKDNPHRLLSQEYGCDYFDRLSDEEALEIYKKVTPKDVEVLVDDLTLNTIYILKGEE